MSIFISDSEQWSNLGSIWSNTDMIHKINEISGVIDNVNTLLRKSSLVSVPQISIYDKNNLAAKCEDLAHYCRNIHAKVENQIDDPFCYGLSKAADQAYMINPRELTIGSASGGTATVVSLIDMFAPIAAIDKDLKAAFDEGVNKIDNQVPREDLQQAIIDSIARKYVGEDVSGIVDGDKRLLIKYYEMLYPDDAKKMNKFLDPVIKDGSHFDDIMNIKFISYKAAEPYKTILFHYLPKISIATYNETGTQRYTPEILFIFGRSISISLDPTKALKDPPGPYYTFFHELGHSMDDMMKLDGVFNRANSGLQDIARNDVRNKIDELLKQEGVSGNNYDVIFESILNNNTSKLTNAQLTKYQNVITEYEKQLNMIGSISSAQYSDITDVYGGYTNNALRSGWGHKDSYWKGTAQSSELFAGYFAANMTGYSTHMDGFNVFFSGSTEFLNDEMANAVNKIGSK